MILHPFVDLLSHGGRFAKVYSFHIGPEVLLHQMQKLGVKGDAFLQKQAVGKSDHIVAIILQQSRCQVLEQRELDPWRTKGDTHIHTLCAEDSASNVLLYKTN